MLNRKKLTALLTLSLCAHAHDLTVTEILRIYHAERTKLLLSGSTPLHQALEYDASNISGLFVGGVMAITAPTVGYYMAKGLPAYEGISADGSTTLIAPPSGIIGLISSLCIGVPVGLFLGACTVPLVGMARQWYTRRNLQQALTEAFRQKKAAGYNIANVHAFMAQLLPELSRDDPTGLRVITKALSAVFG